MSSETAITIGSEPLSTSIKRLLLSRIVNGDYGPGERIVESRLAKELKISQSPVREALRDLAAMGMVEIESRRGARVRKPTVKELRDVVEVRAEVDALAARLAATRVNPDAVEALRIAQSDMDACFEAKDYAGLTEADARFHGILARESGNEAVERVFDQLEPFARTFITLAAPQVELSQILCGHSEILDALVAEDSELAAERARSHRLHVRDAFFQDSGVVEAYLDGSAA